MHNTQSLHNILKKNNINTSFTNNIIITNNEFYKKFISRRENQIGGQKTINFIYHNKTYDIDHYDETDRHTYELTPKTKNGQSCFIIIIPKNEKTKYAYLENISSYEDCLHVGHLRNGRGSHLLKVVLAFIDSIKTKYELKYIQLQDNSNYLCKDKGKIELSSLYMLTQGNTWYGKYGFKPFDPESESLHLDNYVNYLVNIKLVNILKIECTNLYELIVQTTHINKNEILTNDKITKIFKKYNKKTIKEFFTDFLKNYDLTCDIFYDIYKNFMEHNGIVRLHQISYYKKL